MHECLLTRSLFLKGLTPCSTLVPFLLFLVQVRSLGRQFFRKLRFTRRFRSVWMSSAPATTPFSTARGAL